MEAKDATCIAAHFDAIEDPRRDRGKLHKLNDILIIALSVPPSAGPRAGTTSLPLAVPNKTGSSNDLTLSMASPLPTRFVG